MTDLITAIEDALSGTLSHDGASVPVYVRGHVEDEVPCVVIERPRSDGNEYLDRTTTKDARLRIRVHDRKGNSHGGTGWYVLRAPVIADKVHQELKPSVEVAGSDVAFLEPDRRPIDYEAEGESALDIALIYDLFLP